MSNRKQLSGKVVFKRESAFEYVIWNMTAILSPPLCTSRNVYSLLNVYSVVYSVLDRFLPITKQHWRTSHADQRISRAFYQQRLAKTPSGLGHAFCLHLCVHPGMRILSWMCILLCILSRTFSTNYKAALMHISRRSEDIKGFLPAEISQDSVGFSAWISIISAYNNDTLIKTTLNLNGWHNFNTQGILNVITCSCHIIA